MLARAAPLGASWLSRVVFLGGCVVGGPWNRQEKSWLGIIPVPTTTTRSVVAFLPPWRVVCDVPVHILVAMVALVLSSSSQEKSLLGIEPVPSATTSKDLAFLLGGADVRLLALLLVLSATLRS